MERFKVYYQGNEEPLTVLDVKYGDNDYEIFFLVFDKHGKFKLIPACECEMY